MIHIEICLTVMKINVKKKSLMVQTKTLKKKIKLLYVQIYNFSSLAYAFHEGMNFSCVADLSINQHTIWPAMTSHHGATRETKREPICTASVQKTGQDTPSLLSAQKHQAPS